MEFLDLLLALIDFGWMVEGLDGGDVGAMDGGVFPPPPPPICR